MLGILFGLLKFGGRSAVRALPREMRQPIRIVMNPVRSARRAITPSVVRDAQRMVNQVTNPVSALARSAENSLWQTAENASLGGSWPTSPTQAVGGPGRQTAEGFMLSAGEPGVELEYQCPSCSLPVLCHIPSYEEAIKTGWLIGGRGIFAVQVKSDDQIRDLTKERVQDRRYFDVLCPHCNNEFRSWIIYEKKFGPYVYEPAPLFDLVVWAIGMQLGVMATVIAFLLSLVLIDSAFFVLIGFLFGFFGLLGLVKIPHSVVAHRFAEIKKYKKSTFLRRFSVRLSAWLGSLGTAIAVVVSMPSISPSSGEATFRVPLIAFLVQAIAVIPISQFLAYYPFDGSGPLLRKASRSGKSEEKARVTSKGKAGILLGIGIYAIAVVLVIFLIFGERDSGDKSLDSDTDVSETVTTKDVLEAHLEGFKQGIVNLQKLHSEIRWDGGESLTQVKDSVEQVHSEVGLLIEGVTATIDNYPPLTSEGRNLREVLLGFEDYYRVMLERTNITEIRYRLFNYKEEWPPVVTAAVQWEKVLQRVIAYLRLG